MPKKLFSLFILLIISIQCSLPDAPDEIVPVVALIYPFPGALISENFTVTIEASDEDKVAEVWVYFDGELIAQFDRKPYELDIDISAKKDGLTHSLQAFAEDKSGNIGFSPNTTFIIIGSVDDTPVGDILYPQAGSILSGIVDISVNASDNISVDYIEFYIDGFIVYIDSSSSDGWNYNWDTAPYADGGAHYVYVKVYDNLGNSAFTEVVRVTVPLIIDNETPTVNFIHPLNNAILKKGIINIFAEISDNGNVEFADFYIDGQLSYTDNDGEPWQYSWDNSSLADNDRHSLFIKATDSSGNVGTSNLIIVTISGDRPGDNTPPNILILYPINGLELSGIITINANIQEENVITRVEFYVDGNLLGIDTQYPYNLSWDTGNFADNQQHTIFIKAYDDSGNEGLSNIVIVNITP